MKYPCKHLLWSAMLLCMVMNQLQAQNLFGSVFTPDDLPLSDIKIQVNEGDGMILTTTDLNGYFTFEATPSLQGYMVKPSKEDNNPLNGINLFDVVMILKHILSVDVMESPYQRVAADVNGSGTITTLDLVKLRRMILHIDDDFDSVNSWRFVDANFDFEGLTLSSIPPFEEFRFLEAIVAGQSTIDFIGVKTGDVNFTADPGNLLSVDERNLEVLNMNIESVSEADMTTVVFKSSDIQNLTALQFSLHFDNTIAEFVDINGRLLENINEENIGENALNEGILTFGWLDLEASFLEKGVSLFEMRFKTTDAERLLKSLKISSDVTEALAFQPDGTPLNVRLQTTHDTKPIDINLNVFPNPFHEQATVAITMPSETTATIEVFDATGRVLQSTEQQWSAGYQEVILHKKDLGISSPALLFIRLKAKEKILTKKLVISD